MTGSALETTYAEALEESLAEAGYLSGIMASRYAAPIRLARSLARKMDDLEARAWLNAAGKPDTATAGQYLKALEVLGLVPPKRAAGSPERVGGGDGGTGRKPLSKWRDSHLKVV